MALKNHFDDCPFGCNDSGKILDTATGDMVDCPYCSKLKKDLLVKGVVIEDESNNEVLLADILGIKSKYLSRKYVYESVIPEGERIFIEEDSLDYFKDESEKLYNLLSLGEMPSNSYCFGISIKGNVDKIAYPMLSVAYMNGLSVCKFITCSELLRLQLRGDDILDEFFKADVLIMMIGEGSTKGEISCAKGMMQSRALKGKSTIFLTTWTIEACSLLLGYSSGEDNLFLAKPVFVKYRNSKKSSKYINQLTGVDNEQYNEDTGVGNQYSFVSDL